MSFLLPMTESILYSHSYADDRAVRLVAQPFATLIRQAQVSPAHRITGTQTHRLNDWVVALTAPFRATLSLGVMNFMLVCATMFVAIIINGEPFTPQDHAASFALFAAALVILSFAFHAAIAVPARRAFAYMMHPKVRARLFAPVLQYRNQPLWRHRDTLYALAVALTGPTLIVAGLLAINPNGPLVGHILDSTIPAFTAVNLLYATLCTTAICQLVAISIQACWIAYVGTSLAWHVREHDIRIAKRITSIDSERLIYHAGNTGQVVAIAALHDNTPTTLGIRHCTSLNPETAAVTFPEPILVNTPVAGTGGTFTLHQNQTLQAHTVTFGTPIATSTL